MKQKFHVVPKSVHDRIVCSAFEARGYDSEESAQTARLCFEAAKHGIRTHNAIKALHLDELFGSSIGGCQPGAQVEIKPNRFAATAVWDAHKKIGPPVAYEAIDKAIELAETYGVGMVSVDNAFHYFWGGGYVLEAAKRGFIAYTQCTALLAEVVPFGGKRPALGTNPHSWGFPTMESAGFPVLVDWATSSIAMGRIQQLAREGKSLPQNCAVDANGDLTTDPANVAALLPFGAHKGYGLGLINELMAGFIGGGMPSMRGRFKNVSDDDHKKTPCFFFLVIHPEALSNNDFGKHPNVSSNIEALLKDVLGDGNEGAILPGQLEAEFARQSDHHKGVLFTSKELDAIESVASSLGLLNWKRHDFPVVTV